MSGAPASGWRYTPPTGALPLLEQIAAGQRCDLLLGVTPDCLSACGELFAPYAPEAAADIPGAYRDSEDRWTPFSLLPVVLIYNDQLVQRNVPDSWSSLTSSAWRGRIACPDPTVSATGCTALEAMTQALDGEAEQVLADFVRCVGDVLPTAEDVVTAVADGRCYVGVTTEDLAMQAAASAQRHGDLPREGSVVRRTGAAIIADCAHEDNARAFIDFLLSGEVQDRLTRQYRRTVFTPRATPPCPHALAYDPYAAGAHQAETLDIWSSLTAEETP